MTDERKEQRKAEEGFKKMFFEALTGAGYNVSIDEDGLIVIRNPRRRKKEEKDT